MARSNPWGENWRNENCSSAEMDTLLAQVFGPKCAFMGFEPAGKRKWVRTRKDGVMEVIALHSDRRFIFYAGFGLSFPWIPHGDWKQVRWHRTPRSAVIDLGHESAGKVDWSMPKGRTLASDRAKVVSTELCESCEPWFAAMGDERRVLEELERLRNAPYFYEFVQQLTVYLFWQARARGHQEIDAGSERQLRSYVGDAGFLEVKYMVEKEATRFR